MSVIVFDFERNVMIADTAVTYGSHTTYLGKKVFRTTIDGDWSCLVGHIGTQGLSDPGRNYVIELLRRRKAEGIDLRRLGDNYLAGYDEDIFKRHGEWLNALRGQYNGSPDGASIIVAVKDLHTEDVVVGVLDHALSVTWGIKPLPGLRAVCIGTPEVVTAFNAASRLDNAKGVVGVLNVNYIGTVDNVFEIHGFDGNVTTQRAVDVHTRVTNA